MSCVIVNTLFNFWRQNSVYKGPRFSIESQGYVFEMYNHLVLHAFSKIYDYLLAMCVLAYS